MNPEAMSPHRWRNIAISSSSERELECKRLVSTTIRPSSVDSAVPLNLRRTNILTLPFSAYEEGPRMDNKSDKWAGLISGYPNFSSPPLFSLLRIRLQIPLPRIRSVPSDKR
jgi:hypothetical protein